MPVHRQQFGDGIGRDIKVGDEAVVIGPLARGVAGLDGKPVDQDGIGGGPLGSPPSAASGWPRREILHSGHLTNVTGRYRPAIAAILALVQKFASLRPGTYGNRSNARNQVSQG